MTMTQRKHTLLLLALFLIPALLPASLRAQSVTYMLAHDTIVLDACTLGSGTIYDNGGPLSDYANGFDGAVLIQASAGLTITLSGSYQTESCCDWLTIHDDQTTYYSQAGGTGTVSVSTTRGQLLVSFHSDGSVVSSGFELNWAVSGVSDVCTNPVTGLDTTAVTATSISLSWNATNAAGPFTVVCNDQTYSGITGTSHTLTGLNPATSYDITVVATAAAGNRCCADRLFVRTACGSADMPFREGFEGLAEGSFPSCWLQVVNFDDEESLPQVVATHHSSGSRSLMLSCGNNDAAGHFGLVATPPLQGVGSHTVRLQLRASHSSTYVQVGTCDSAGSDYNQYGFTTIQSFYVDNTTQWREYSFTWTPSSNGRRLALRMQQSQQNGIGRRLYIDDMGIENCGIDSLRVYHVEYDRVTLAWSSYGNPTCNVGVRREGAMVDSLSFSNVTPPLDITGLDAETNYIFTVYPTCQGSLNIARSVTARTAVMPTAADGYCSNFSQSQGLPPEWTFNVLQAYCGGNFNLVDRAVYFRDGCSGVDAYMASERLTGLPGTQVSVTFSGENNGAMVILGTMVHPDDITTFVPLDTAWSDGGRHTFTATVPTNSTGRHIAIRLGNPGWYVDVRVHSVTGSRCAIEEPRVLHRRGTHMELSWAQPYDTVLVQYGPHGFALGSGVVDTFYHVDHASIGGLVPSTEYDLFFYRPCQTPCEDMRYQRRSATQDYTLPWCEDLESLNGNAWSTTLGDWQRVRQLNDLPGFVGQSFGSDGSISLQMSSWGFTWDYYSMAMLPDVEVDSTSVLSFYIYDMAPQSTLIVGTVPDDYQWPAEHFRVLDTIHISANNARRHYSYELRPSDTLFDGRLVLAYQHPYEYSYYSCYIDEMQIEHASYGTLQVVHTGFDTLAFDLSWLHQADSVEVTLVGGGNIFADTVQAADIHSIGFGGLDTGTLYYCYVRPLAGGCRSFAGYAITLSYGIGGYGDCFNFSDVLSYELPYHWAADSTTLVTTGDYLQLRPRGSVAMHPMTGIDRQSFSFRARSSVPGDTLLLGWLPADSIPVPAATFTTQAQAMVPIDTFVVGADWEYYMMRLPALAADTLRLLIRGGAGVTDLDELEISYYPHVHFAVDGNVVDCSVDADQMQSYYLTVTDSASGEERTMYVQTNPFRVTGLQMDKTYYFTWRCLYQTEGCRPVVRIHTGGLIPLPYCEDFNVANGTLTVPPTWTFIKNNTSNDVSLDTWGPSLRMDPGNNRWMYAVLPELAVDSALSLHSYFYTWTDGGVQIGVMDNATDTSSFLPLWTSYNNDWQQADVELSQYVDKRIAIRTRADMRLFNMHVYGYPLPKISLVAARTLKFTTSTASPYWLHYFNPWNSSEDTMFYVDTTVFYIHDTNILTSGHATILQTDSAGYTCEGNREYNLSYRSGVPWCYDASWGTFGFVHYAAWGHSGPGYVTRDNYNQRATRFYGNSSSWAVLEDFNVDSIRHAGLKIRYDAGSVFDTLVVGVMTDAYDTASFTPVDTLTYTITDTLQQAFVDFLSYADTGRWIALHHLWNQNASWFDVRYLYVDGCPGALGATASLSRWNRVKIDGPHTPFYVEYGYSDNGQGSGANTIMRVDSVPLILILDPETRYDFYFRCDSNSYTCVPKQQVTTLAAPLELPSCIDFDTVRAGTIPRSWTARNVGIGATNAVAHSDTNSLVMPIASNSYMITPDINVDSIQKVALSLWYQVEDLSDRLVVGVMSNPADMSTFHPVRTLAPLETGVWQHGLVEFSAAPDDAHFIALRARSNRQAGGRSIYVDDIYVTSCAAFDFTVQRLTNNSIDLTWSHVGNPNVTVSVIDDGQVSQVFNNAEPPLHIEPLTTLHYYTFRFESECSATDTGYCSTNYRDSLSVVTPAPGTGCVNPTDMASPQAVFFSGSYRNPYAHAGAVNYGSQHPDSRHTVCYDTAQRDPRTSNLLRTIPVGYTSSVRLGNWSTNAYTPEAEGVIYSLFVDTSSFELLLLRYAAVLQDPMHAPSDQPRFRMELLDTNYNIIDSACTSADFIADQSLGWNSAEDGVLWKDWTAVGVDLSAHAGEQVYFRLTTYDCNEGSHYGYAYFTLECMRKNMNTVSCGDVDSNTLSAPEGFHYRWYTSQSGSTVSTNQSITVPSQDITYYCDVSKLDNPSCHFVISAYGGTRYPMASFDTSMTVDSCRFYVSFTNTSGVSNDGVTPLAGEHCESAYWDYGNGTTSVNYHGYAVYTHPGTYTVRLISGIALDECQDTAVMTLTLTLPAGMAPSDTTVVSICDNQSYLYYGQPYTDAGEYYHIVPIPNETCDSINVLQLSVRPTSLADTVAVVCDSISWHGGVYYVSDTLTAPVGFNSVSCDSTLRLALTVNYSSEVDDSIYICPGYPYLYRGVDYGGPVVFDELLPTRHNCDSLVHVSLIARDSNYHLSVLYRFDSTDWQEPDSVLKSCDPTQLEIRDSTEGAVAHSWQLFMRDTVVASADTFFSYRFEEGQDAMTAYLSLVVTDTIGCYDTLSWPLFVLQSAIPDFHTDPDVPAMHNPETQFVNLTWPDTVDYLWRIQQQEGGMFDTISEVAPLYRWGEAGDNMAGEYTVRLLSFWSHTVPAFRVDTVDWIDSTLRNVWLYETFTHTCIDSVEHVVTITNDYLQFPNLVSPNGDGTNDTWRVVNLLEMGNYSMNELWIYDRTGALVYHVKNIRREDQFWNPLDTRSPDGTYYYRFMAQGQYGLVKRNGVIEVVR